MVGLIGYSTVRFQWAVTLASPFLGRLTPLSELLRLTRSNLPEAALASTAPASSTSPFATSTSMPCGM